VALRSRKQKEKPKKTRNEVVKRGFEDVDAMHVASWIFFGGRKNGQEQIMGGVGVFIYSDDKE